MDTISHAKIFGELFEQLAIRTVTTQRQLQRFVCFLGARMRFSVPCHGLSVPTNPTVSGTRISGLCTLEVAAGRIRSVLTPLGRTRMSGCAAPLGVVCIVSATQSATGWLCR